MEDTTARWITDPLLVFQGIWSSSRVGAGRTNTGPYSCMVLVTLTGLLAGMPGLETGLPVPGTHPGGGLKSCLQSGRSRTHPTKELNVRPALKQPEDHTLKEPCWDMPSIFPQEPPTRAEFQENHSISISLLTLQVPVPNRPRLCGIEVRVSSYAVAGEVGVCQEPSLAIERAGISVEPVGEEEHDVREVGGLVLNVTVRDLSEAQRRDTLPHLEGSSDGVVGFVLPDLGGVVLYAEERKERRRKDQPGEAITEK